MEPSWRPMQEEAIDEIVGIADGEAVDDVDAVIYERCGTSAAGFVELRP